MRHLANGYSQALVNANADLAAANSRYVMRITGDNDEGKAQLDNFIDPESTFPVIATASQLMSTGVDAQTYRLIALDKRIFKQIIGRGMRINEYYNKLFFTIMDFKRATVLFGARLMVVEGELQNEMNVVHVVVHKCNDYSHWLARIQFAECFISRKSEFRRANVLEGSDRSHLCQSPCLPKGNC